MRPLNLICPISEECMNEVEDKKNLIPMTQNLGALDINSNMLNKS